MGKYNDKVSEPMLMTYGMSENLVNSGLLTQISGLSTADKKCLINYITQEVAIDEDDDDVWDTHRAPQNLKKRINN